MPIFGTGPKRLDGRTNPQINATIRYLSSPNTISNLSFWFDANDNTTIQLQQGNTSNITGWTSKGNFPIQISTIAQVAPLVPNNAVLPYTVPNGLNGRQTIFMNGVSSMLQFTSSVNNTTVATNNETTIFTVANPTNAANNAILFAYDFSFFNRIVNQINFATAGTSFFYGNGSPTALVGGSGGTFFGLGYYQNTFYRRNSDTSIAIKFRGAPLTSATNNVTLNSNSHFAIGGFPGLTSFNNPYPYFNTLPRFFIGNYAEILWYNRGLTDDEIVGVEGYLAKKWGIQNQLRFNHIGVATGPPLMGYRLITYPRLVSNYGLWYDAMDTSTIKDVGGNFPPLLPPNALGVGTWNDKSGNNRHLTNSITNPSQFNLMSPGTFYPVVFSPGYISGFPTLGGYFNLRNLVGSSLYTGCNISAFFVFSLSPNANNNTYFALTSTVNAMPIPFNPSGPNVSTFDLNLNFINNTIGFSRFGGGTAAFGSAPVVPNNIITAPFTTNTTGLIQLQINGTQNTIGNVLPSTNMITINGAFVSSSTTYAGNPFNLQYISMFGGYNYPANSISFFNEVAVFYRTLTTPERLLIENQLINKWKLPSNAPISFINNLPVRSGLFGWYDAYDQTTVLRNSSNNVSMWLDKSGQSNHMSTVLCQYGSNTQSNIYYSSIGVSTNSLSALFFPSTFAIMTTSTLIVNQTFSTFSIISVGNFFKLPNGPTPRNVSLYSTLQANDMSFVGSVLNNAGAANIPVNTLTSNFSTFHINTMLVNLGTTTDTGSGIVTSNAVTYFNGVSNQTTTGLIYSGMIQPSYISLMGSGITNTPAEGDLRNNSGSLAEILMYNRILNTTELTNVHSYLLNKWNITPVVSNLPVVRGLNLWLDAYDPDTVIFSTNTNLVRQWRDKSISTLHFSNALTDAASKPPLYTTNPANNLPGLFFSNSAPTTSFYTNIYNCNFNYPRTTEATLFVTYANAPSAGFYGPLFTALCNSEIFFNSANGFGLEILNGNNSINILRSSISIYSSGIANTVNTPTLATVVFNSSFSTTLIADIPQNNFAVGRNGMIGITQLSSFISTNSNLTVSTLNFTVNQAVLGTRGAGTTGDAQWYYAGYIHEVLLYNRTLSFVERQQVESYLLSKWKI